jgi:hypothetical protein
MSEALKNRRGLIALNACLLAVLALVTLGPAAQAQRGGGGGAGRARGEYTMLSGRTGGSSVHAVYVVDSANQEVLGLQWSQTRKGLESFGYRDLSADARAMPGR